MKIWKRTTTRQIIIKKIKGTPLKKYFKGLSKDVKTKSKTLCKEKQTAHKDPERYSVKDQGDDKNVKSEPNRCNNKR